MLISNTGSGLTASTSACTPFLPVGSIHQHNLPAEDLQVYPLQPGQAVLAQRRSRRVSTHRPTQTVLEPRHLVEEMPTTSGEYRLASSTSSFSFPLSEVMFQFPITSLWRDCHLHVVLKSPRVEALRAVPVHLPGCVVGARWGFHLWMPYLFDCKPHLNIDCLSI